MIKHYCFQTIVPRKFYCRQWILWLYLQGIDLQLKHVCATGIYGWSNICETVVGEWLEDIAHNQVFIFLFQLFLLKNSYDYKISNLHSNYNVFLQIRNLLKGLPPIKSLSAVSSGTKKLVSLPVKSYKKEHKFLKGMQRGKHVFMFYCLRLDVCLLLASFFIDIGWFIFSNNIKA